MFTKKHLFAVIPTNSCSFDETFRLDFIADSYNKNLLISGGKKKPVACLFSPSELFFFKKKSNPITSGQTWHKRKKNLHSWFTTKEPKSKCNSFCLLLKNHLQKVSHNS